MIITLSANGKKVEIDYLSFIGVRMSIASLCPEEIKQHYLDLARKPLRNADEIEAYDKKTMDIYNRYPNRQKVMEFLYSAEKKDAEFPWETSSQLLTVIGNNNTAFYQVKNAPGRIVSFKSLRNVLSESARTKSPLKMTVSK